MSEVYFTSDLHLGHKNICKFRDGFEDAEDHHNKIYENLVTTVNKRDSVFFMGDVAFTGYWLDKIANIDCAKKVLIIGNHDTDKMALKNGVTFENIFKAYDEIHGIHSRYASWLSHCPIHPDEFYRKQYNIHGHLHNKLVMKNEQFCNGECDYFKEVEDSRYINVCLEHTNNKPISLTELRKKYNI